MRKIELIDLKYIFKYLKFHPKEKIWEPCAYKFTKNK